MFDNDMFHRIAKNLVNLLAIRNNIRRNPCIADDEKYREFEAKFAYTPTADQISCFDQVTDDLVNQTRPMDRLICGDVGFGKTEVAMRAAYRVVLSNRQVITHRILIHLCQPAYA